MGRRPVTEARMAAMPMPSAAMPLRMPAVFRRIPEPEPALDAAASASAASDCSRPPPPAGGERPRA
eukprot:2468652-Prorocentrum_lima.AAC.1